MTEETKQIRIFEEGLMHPMPVNVEDFEEIKYTNDDVDTDRGTWRQRSFELQFKTHTIILSEEDFESLTIAMTTYVDHMKAERQHDNEMHKEWEQKNGQ